MLCGWAIYYSEKINKSWQEILPNVDIALIGFIEGVLQQLDLLNNYYAKSQKDQIIIFI
jgi:hypothetical protein